MSEERRPFSLFALTCQTAKQVDQEGGDSNRECSPKKLMPETPMG